MIFQIIALSLIAILVPAARYAWWIYAPSVRTGGQDYYLLIPTGATFRQVTDSLTHHHLLRSEKSFAWVAKKKNYADRLKPGRYRITDGMNNNDLVNLLRSGKQEPVRLVFNNIRTKSQLAGRIARQIETDSVRLLVLLNDPDFLKKLGLTPENAISLFIPNTYEILWNTGPERLISRMQQEYERFWNETRREKANRTGLSPLEVSTLASIVEAETSKEDEKPVIAGVYLNRLRRGIPLEADPTVIFAIGDFSIRRVLAQDLMIDSPYNTYKNKGLPPGPIYLPSIASIDAVLDAEKHDFLFFCARPDLSGYHLFARNLSSHLENARAYRSALDKLEIKR